MKDVQIVYRPGRENDRADDLSCNPVTVRESSHLEVGAQVAQASSASEKDIINLLQEEPGAAVAGNNFHLEQKKDPELDTLLTW